ncbi:DUF3349 domain-containing protein [Rhodococcus sp. HNM0563]|uniref:DUF3349 domain-containing protein n=1 Tax=unclassified Rhodococcus (in: high G+C Gram-positive bacteria) TaxID=192944 RepID=UPI00146F40E4|nr:MULTISPECIES: DUF3349 domain-containing protein [unclassified Rhodococcus (in: high G+C Gram-positive bacteria)]MCK0090081.1 DUF3349 domain-containing protein [Rhodococcus sp. F64268]NLU64608.1 DUF3349 domain-containing protein [Rhodococcus sp. HNM0563]
MPRYSLRSVLDWLRAGYPEGIPPKDHFALLSVLRRRLTDEDIAEILELSVATAHEHPQRKVDYDTLRKIIAGVLNEQPTDDDIARVTEQLVAGGWPVVGTDEQDDDIEQSVTDGARNGDRATGDDRPTGSY